MISPPIVITHNGIQVVRDDLFGGGTKARFLPRLFDGVDEVVYASPQEGGAQTALATVARQLGKRATVFVAGRKNPHPRVAMVRALGGNVVEVKPGYLSVVQARAREYCKTTGAFLAPFGMDVPEAIEIIADAALATRLHPDEVWCAAGSGVLARGLALAWPHARRHVVQVGRELSPVDVVGAVTHVAGVPYEKPCRALPPFPSDPHYDAKAWELALYHGLGQIVFWNVTGPACNPK